MPTYQWSGIKGKVKVSGTLTAANLDEVFSRLNNDLIRIEHIEEQGQPELGKPENASDPSTLSAKEWMEADKKEQESYRPFPPLTCFLIVSCVVVALISSFGDDVSRSELLLIGSARETIFSEVMAGEVWRLVTPVFLHFGYMHLIFNMVWLWELGGVIENTKGPFQLLLMSIVIGVGSNVTQYVIDGPYFGGMSGVVFGFLCFLWVQGKFNRHFDMHVRNTTIVWMLGWYVICWTGLVGSIANWAHTGGLVLGCVWAVIAVTIDRFASRHEPVV